MVRNYALLIVFQSYEDDGQLIMKGRVVCDWTPFTIKKISALEETGI